MNAIVQDVRYALRRLRKSLGFSAVIILTLAIGIGANTAIFTVINAVLLRPLPYSEPGQLVTVFHHYASLNAMNAPVSAPGFRDYRDRTQSFQSVAVETGWAPNLTGEGDPERLNASRVSGLWFQTLGEPPVLGRTLRPDEDAPGNNRVVVLSHGFWQRTYGGDSGVVGRSVQLNGEAYEIVGVMGPGFRDYWNRTAELWTPLALAPSTFGDNNRTNEFLNLVARLKPGAKPSQAQAEMTTLATTLKQEFPDSYAPAWTLSVRSLDEYATRNIRPALLVLLGSVCFVLLIACANVANLLLARAASRIKEVAVRTALGAKRAQLVRQFLAESVVLAGLGGVLGMGLAYAGVRALVTFNASVIPRSDEIRIDATVMAFSLGVSLLTGIVFGLVPALQSSRPQLSDTLREGGRSGFADRSGNYARRTLAVAQVALALSLLAGAGLLIKSFARLQNVDPGFNPDQLLTFNLSLPTAKYRSDTAWSVFYAQALPAIAAVPGVQAVGGTTVLPFSGGWSTGSFHVEGFEPPENQNGPWGDIRSVTHGFFETMQMPVMEGRAFGPEDRPGSRLVVVVDDVLAERYWPGQSAIGKRITRDDPAGPGPVRWFEVIGVVGHSKQEALDAENRVQLYASAEQFPRSALTFAVRTSADPLTLARPVAEAVRSIDPDLPIARVSSMDALMSSSVGQRRLSMVLIALFAGTALLLAALGIYGVMSYSVTQRSHEMGVRMALGAARRDVLRMVLRQGMTLATVGVAGGLAGALVLTRLIRTQLFGVAPTDPSTFITVAGLLIATALVASLLPALRATRVDPAVALRDE